MRYHFQAIVERQVLDTISLAVETEGGVKDALGQAQEALVKFPQPVNQEGVGYMYIENRENTGTKVVRIERRAPTQDGTA